MTVFDTSALVALIAKEPGGQRVKIAIRNNAIINTVNYAELLKYFNQYDYDSTGIVQHLLNSGLAIREFSKEEAEISASMYHLTKPLGLSLGDRACLATAIFLDADVITADKIWSKLKFPDLRIISIR